MKIANVSTGFSEVPGQISLNIYAQGCKMGCKGCQNPDLWNMEAGVELSIKHFSKLLENKLLPTFICWLGGDVTYQPDGLREANRYFKEKGYRVCLYTGKQFSEIKDLLDDVDMVVDGKWEGKTIHDKDTNQKVYLKLNNEWKNVNIQEVKELLKENKNVDKAIV